MIQYSSTIDKFVTLNGIFTWEEMDYFDRLEKQWKNSLPHYSFNELIKIFPEAKSVARKHLEEEIVFYRKQLNTIDDIEKDYRELVYRKSSKENEAFWNDVVSYCVEPARAKLLDMIKRNSFYILALSNKEPKGGITQSDIEQAKKYPISSLVNFNNHGVARCIFHNERTGSLHYYRKTNTVHCFGCDKSADVIDVYRHIHGVDFISAVKALI